MRKIKEIIISVLAFPLFVFPLGACGQDFYFDKPEDNTAPKNNPSVFSVQADNQNQSQATNACGPEQKMEDHKPVWVFHQCKKADSIHITPETKNDWGALLGNKPMNRGMLSVRFTELHNDDISGRENFGIFFKAGGNSGSEVNWQWMSYSIGGGDIMSRIIIQRFDGTCPRFCEHSELTDELQFRNYKDVWQWDCYWDTSKGKVSCQITKPGGNPFKVVVTNDPMGPYNSLKYLGIGKGAFMGPYPSYQGIISDVKLTVFD